MANVNPDHPTESVALGEQPTLSRKVPGPAHSRGEAYQNTAARVTDVLQALDRALSDPMKRPGDDVLDGAYTALNFCRLHLQEPLRMLSNEKE